MADRMARFRDVAAMAQAPTPYRRMLAAAAAGSIALGLTYLLLWALVGPAPGVLIFASLALGVAAAVAAATMRLPMAITYGLLAAVWLTFELVVAAIAVAVSCIG